MRLGAAFFVVTFLAASCSAFTGEDEDTPVPVDAGQEAGVDAQADGPVTLEDSAVTPDGAPEDARLSGDVVTACPAAKATVTGPMIVQGKLCKISAPLLKMCDPEVRFADVIEIPMSSTVTTAKITPTGGTIHIGPVEPTGCTGSSCTSYPTINGPKDFTVQPGTTLAVGATGAGCVDYRLDFN